MRQYKPGDLIGGEFLVKEVFGGENRSGMGVVYLVENREIPQPIVLKTFQNALDARTKQQFMAEAKAWINAGSHRNIVQAFWAREIADQVFVAAEYVEPDEDGRNNVTHFLGSDPISLELALSWAAQFCHGMEYVQSKGVLAHRDIKPDNLMVDRDFNLKVTDFGLAKAIDGEEPLIRKGWWPFGEESAKTVSQTRTGSMMGTLPYMAPEQFIDAKKVDHTADIYGFGIVLYQLVTGNRYPYRIDDSGASVTEAFFRAHAYQKPVEANSPLMGVISRCLAKSPKDRYSSYDALLRDITAIATKLGVRLPKYVAATNEDKELYSQAQSYVALGDSDRALSAIDEYVSKYGHNECGWTEKGRIHFERGEFREGVTATLRSLEINPSNTHAWNNMGLLLSKTGAPLTEVRSAYEAAVRLDPQNSAALMNLFMALSHHGELEAAVNYAARAIALRSEKPSLVHNLNVLLKDLIDRRDYPLATRLLEAWTKARPQDVDAWHNLGVQHLNNGEFKAAITCFETVHALDSGDNFAVAQLAKLKFQEKRGRDCLRYCDLLLERGEDILLAVSLKARVLNFMGGLEPAERFIRPYLQANPGNDALWMILAEMLEYRGDFQAAISALLNAKKALERAGHGSNSENMQLVLEKLEQLSADSR